MDQPHDTGRDTELVGPLLRALEFRSGYGEEEFRFAGQTGAAELVVDCLFV